MQDVSYAGWNVCQNFSFIDMLLLAATVFPVQPPAVLTEVLPYEALVLAKAAVSRAGALVCRKDTVLAAGVVALAVAAGACGAAAMAGIAITPMAGTAPTAPQA